MTWFGVTIILGVWRAIPREKRGALYLGLALGVVAVVSMVMAMGGPRHILQEAVRRVFTASGVPFTMPPAQGVKR